MTASVTGHPRRNAVLERLLARADWTPENLGDRLNELAMLLRLRARLHRRTPADGCTPRRERRPRCLPHDPWPTLVCHLLHERLGEPVTLDALGWTATDHCGMCPPITDWTSHGTPPGQ